MKPKPTPSIVQKPRTDPGRLSVRKGQIITLSTRSNNPKPFGKLETQRVRTIQAEMHEAFAARPGAEKGIRLIQFDSLMNYIASFGEE